MNASAGFLVRSIALRIFVAMAAVTSAAVAARAEVKLPAIFSDHMVVQADAIVPVWGWAEPGEKISVSLAHQTQTATADKAGKWLVKLGKLKPASEPQSMTVQGSNRLTVDDVLVGEVWLASGQSNMEMQLERVDRADEEQAAARYPRIRMFMYDRSYSIYDLAAPPDEPQVDRPGRWWVCTPETAGRFSAVGYFFARELHEQLHTPVGIISAAVGGTPIEAWTSLESQQAQPQLGPMLDDWRKKLAGYDAQRQLQAFNAAKQSWLKRRAAARNAGQPDPKAPAAFKNLGVMQPAGLFNGLIAPLVPYALRGVIWYQGERNALGPFSTLYGRQLTTLIRDWRTRWGSELYFAWVQLPRFQREQREPSEPSGWGVAVRDEMRKTLALARTGMAITIDLGGATEGHPTGKAEFARRLALPVLHDVYGKPIANWSGPLFRSARREGNKIAVTFDHATGLKASSEELQGFAIAGDDQVFVWANAQIVGDQVVVSSDAVTEPIAVRYAWAANPKGNLVNGASLPASPFRTDDW